MKIGIITLWQSTDNYGQILQMYALQEYLRQKGHEPFLIRFDFDNRKEHLVLWKEIIKTLLVFPVLKRNKTRKMQKQQRKMLNTKNKVRKFDEFKQQHLQVSNVLYHTYSELKSNPPVADCYITGSDQVWAQLLSNPENRAMFLDFGNEDTIRASYAASFAMKEYPSELHDKLRKQLEHFDYISVRESDGLKICKGVGYDAKVVLDPTFLLQQDSYQSLISKIKTRHPYLFIYSLNIFDAEEIRWSDWNKYASQTDLDVVVTPASGYTLGGELFGDKVNYDYATVQGWLTNIANASMVVTTSFHGIVYCILLKTNFVYVPLSGKFSQGNNRVLDLLEKLDLQERVQSPDMSIDKVCKNNIDWDSVYEKLNTYIGESQSFINKIIQ